MEIYLDNAATTVCDGEAAREMARLYTEEYGNPSSAHRLGFRAERELHVASEHIAKTLRCTTDEIFFTSGGTEADNLALFGAAYALRRTGTRIITTAIEHPAVLECAKRLAGEGFDVVFLPVDQEGLVRRDVLREALTEETVLVSVMAVNNEIGTVEPLREIGALVKERCPQALFHTDAVQAYGKVPLDVKEAKIDLLSASAHKLHGPKGAGLLYVRRGVRLIPQILGGHQQKNLRSGTENVPGCAGFALAAKKAFDGLRENAERLYALRAFFCEEAEKRLTDIRINGPSQETDRERISPYIISLSVPGVRAEVLLHALEDRGIFVSGGSACASNHPQISGTLQAIGLEKALLESTIRISLSKLTTKEELEEMLAALAELLPALRRFTAH